MPKQAPKLNPRLEDILQKILVQTEDLLRTNLANAIVVCDESESKKVTIGLRSTIDLSESVGHMDTTLGYSQVVKDTRSTDLEDAQQPSLGGDFQRDGAKAQDVEVETPTKPFNPAFVEETAAKKKGKK